MILKILDDRKKLILIVSVVVFVISLILSILGLQKSQFAFDSIRNIQYSIPATFLVLTTIIFCYYYRFYALGLIVGLQLIIILVVFILFNLGYIPDGQIKIFE